MCPRGPLLLLQSSASLSCFCATQLFGGAQGGIGVRRHKSAKLAEILPPVDVACHWRFFGKNSKPAADLLAGKKKLNFIDLYCAASTRRRHQVRCCLEHEKKIELRSALTLPSLKVEMILKNARCKTELCGFPSRQWAPKKVNPQTIGRGAVTFHRWLSSGPMI